MQREGPPLETLTRRLAECPADFLAAPRIGGTGTVVVAAVVADLLRELGGQPADWQVEAFTTRKPKADRNRLSTVLVASWLLHDPWFREGGEWAEPALALLAGGLREAAGATAADKFVSDPDRREELARLCLRELGLRPAGETTAQAQDRLTTLSAAERARVVAAARQAEERAAAIREAMRRREIEEANAKAMRE
ncbi:MAG: hypothetical protein IT317_02485 [Anaerolineales bacterium]|nr:hypothetical protein [Anaerolineales bacterium]